MRHDMNARTRPGTQAAIRLRADRFDAMTNLLGLTTDVARAKLIGVTPKTITRVRAGVIGQEFMAKAVIAMEQHRERLAEFNLAPSLNELFEVVSSPDQQAA